MGISVDIVPCHPLEPAWSAIDRVLGRGTSCNLLEDDSGAPVPLYDHAPTGWQNEFIDGLRPLADWQITVDHGGHQMWTPTWRWHVSVLADEVVCSYRKTGPAKHADLDDRHVLEIAARVGCVVYWSDSISWAEQPWADLRVDPLPEDLG